MTQQNAALVEQAAAAAQSLQDQAGELARVVSIFKLEEGEEHHVPTQAQAKAPAAAPAVTTTAVVARPVVKRPAPPALKKPAAASAAPKKADEAVAAPKPKKAAVSATASADEWEEF
jgi:methyl-accepting chemotaxis protein